MLLIFCMIILDKKWWINLKTIIKLIKIIHIINNFKLFKLICLFSFYFIPDFISKMRAIIRSPIIFIWCIFKITKNIIKSISIRRPFFPMPPLWRIIWIIGIINIFLCSTFIHFYSFICITFRTWKYKLKNSMRAYSLIKPLYYI